MEKISTTPLTHSNSNNFTGISSTNTMTTSASTTSAPQMLSSNVLNLQFDGLSTTTTKKVESSVRAVPLRANFKKSNTCGSLFAKCKCNNHPHHYTTVIPLITQIDCDKQRPKLDRNNRKTQSFSHPDTPVIFTEENRYPANQPNGELIFNRAVRNSQETIIKSGNHKVEIKHSKRASSPNLLVHTNGIDIHPEFKVQVTPKSPIALSATTPPADQDISLSATNSIRRAFLKKSSKSFPFPQQRSSSFRSFDSIGDRTLSSSSYSVDETSEEIELSGKLQSDLLVSEQNNKNNSTTTVAEIHCTENGISENNTIVTNSPLKTQSNGKEFSDEKFLQVKKLKRKTNCTGTRISHYLRSNSINFFIYRFLLTS